MNENHKRVASSVVIFAVMLLSVMPWKYQMGFINVFLAFSIVVGSFGVIFIIKYHTVVKNLVEKFFKSRDPVAELKKLDKDKEVASVAYGILILILIFTGHTLPACLWIFFYLTLFSLHSTSVKEIRKKLEAIHDNEGGAR